MSHALYTTFPVPLLSDPIYDKKNTANTAARTPINQDIGDGDSDPAALDEDETACGLLTLAVLDEVGDVLLVASSDSDDLVVVVNVLDALIIEEALVVTSGCCDINVEGVSSACVSAPAVFDTATAAEEGEDFCPFPAVRAEVGEVFAVTVSLAAEACVEAVWSACSLATISVEVLVDTVESTKPTPAETETGPELA